MGFRGAPAARGPCSDQKGGKRNKSVEVALRKHGGNIERRASIKGGTAGEQGHGGCIWQRRTSWPPPAATLVRQAERASRWTSGTKVLRPHLSSDDSPSRSRTFGTRCCFVDDASMNHRRVLRRRLGAHRRLQLRRPRWDGRDGTICSRPGMFLARFRGVVGAEDRGLLTGVVDEAHPSTTHECLCSSGGRSALWRPKVKAKSASSLASPKGHSPFFAPFRQWRPERLEAAWLVVAPFAGSVSSTTLETIRMPETHLQPRCFEGRPRESRSKKRHSKTLGFVSDPMLWGPASFGRGAREPV
mmetsp:Transcript_8442/g.29833  ORF Transcript_8442/g.29833 Transcript_8442/m.29833 type:complete len:301 (+) Transcript_8442:887-1789(+)